MDDNWTAAIVYRIAFSHAHAALDAARRLDSRPVELCPDPLAARIAAELHAAGQAAARVREAVEDALAGRRPQW